MKILVVAAAAFEISPFLKKLILVKKENEHFVHYRAGNKCIDILMPGIGMMVTAFHMGRRLTQEKYDLAVNAGICGSYIHQVGIGNVVEVVEECIVDIGAEEKDRFLTVFDLGLSDPNSAPYTNGIMINNRSFESDVIRKLPKVKGATVNLIPGRNQNIKNSGIVYSPDIETMEGAAFFYACLWEGIPFTQIRAVSNYVEERDKSKWNISLAVKNLNRILIPGRRSAIRDASLDNPPVGGNHIRSRGPHRRPC